jgi:branched-subunit amino acid aminotransferase/4-amino-4-deoxychorismate lyase
MTTDAKCGDVSAIPVLDRQQVVARFDALRRPYHAKYYAMYSSVLGGIVTDPALMTVPVDDHMVHRGDGVFETFKCVDGRLYNLDAHLARLETSARPIALRAPWTRADLAAIIVATTRAGGRRDCLLRLFLSRGPGSLGISPYDCPVPGLYVLAYEKPPPFMVAHPGGARVQSCPIAVKPSEFARIKSVNYLPNVLMKKMAVDAGVDFVLTFDEHGYLAEGATENAGIVTRAGVLRVPHPERILRGTTMVRVMELAAAAAGQGALRGCEEADISRQDLREAAEVLIFGTTPDVTAVVELDGRPVSDGRPGPVSKVLGGLLTDDIRGNAALQTPAFA